MARLELAEEVGAKKTFVWAVDWPGWCRSGKGRDLALAAVLDHADRYAVVAALAGLTLGPVDRGDILTVESVEGGAATDFGVPSAITPLDRRPVTRAQGERSAGLVEAAWTRFDAVASSAPEALRKGPRGGGRDTSRVVAHVLEADRAYARELGIRLPAPSPRDRAAVRAEREAMLDLLRQPSDGSPIAGRKWPLRYAARRIAWHALDHAWEIEDRTEPVD